MRINNPRSEERIIADSLWAEGNYPFEIAEAKDEVSKKGNDMIVLTMNVLGSDGNSRIFKDWLVEAFPLKLRRCAEVCGLLDKYTSGNIEARDFFRKSGLVEIGQEFPQDGQPRNFIKNYLVGHSKKLTEEEMPDDDMPF